MLFNQMRQAAFSIMQDILQHPFNVELMLGSLPKNKFIFYLEQDALYLTEFSRALTLTSARLPISSDSTQYMHYALECLQAEKSLPHKYLNHADLLSSEMNPTCFMYTHYLLSQATLAPVEVAASSLLPCFSIYQEVGKTMAKQVNLANHPYRDWIELYSSQSFDESVRIAIDIVNRLGAKASADVQRKMINAFFKASQLEWRFWNAAYYLESWQIGLKPTVMDFV